LAWECKGWSAVHDHMPPGTPTLRVTGECEMPTPGYTCELRLHEPQGINPKDLLLDLIVTEPTSSQPEVITPCEVRFEETTETEYETVSIIEVELGIPVQEVSE
jgi:hypothetical protein